MAPVGANLGFFKYAVVGLCFGDTRIALLSIALFASAVWTQTGDSHIRCFWLSHYIRQNYFPSTWLRLLSSFAIIFLMDAVCHFFSEFTVIACPISLLRHVVFGIACLKYFAVLHLYPTFVLAVPVSRPQYPILPLCLYNVSCGCSYLWGQISIRSTFFGLFERFHTFVWALSNFFRSAMRFNCALHFLAHMLWDSLCLFIFLLSLRSLAEWHQLSFTLFSQLKHYYHHQLCLTRVVCFLFFKPAGSSSSESSTQPVTETLMLLHFIQFWYHSSCLGSCPCSVPHSMGHGAECGCQQLPWRKNV